MLTTIENYDNWNDGWTITVCDTKDVLYDDLEDVNYTENPIDSYWIDSSNRFVDENNKWIYPVISSSVFNKEVDKISKDIKENYNISYDGEWIKDCQVRGVEDYCDKNNLDWTTYNDYYDNLLKEEEMLEEE